MSHDQRNGQYIHLIIFVISSKHFTRYWRISPVASVRVCCRKLQTVIVGSTPEDCGGTFDAYNFDAIRVFLLGKNTVFSVQYTVVGIHPHPHFGCKRSDVWVLRCVGKTRLFVVCNSSPVEFRACVAHSTRAPAQRPAVPEEGCGGRLRGNFVAPMSHWLALHCPSWTKSKRKANLPSRCRGQPTPQLTIQFHELTIHG